MDERDFKAMNKQESKQIAEDPYKEAKHFLFTRNEYDLKCPEGGTKDSMVFGYEYLLRAMEEYKLSGATAEYYEKVYIKSEADLPKEDMQYIAFSKVINDFVHAHPIKSLWEDIDWYLKPIPKQEYKPSGATDKKVICNNKQCPHIEIKKDSDLIGYTVCGKSSGVRDELVRFGYKLKEKIHHYYKTWKGEWNMEDLVDEYLKAVRDNKL